MVAAGYDMTGQKITGGLLGRRQAGVLPAFGPQ
jgi:hypothetical protein